MTSPALVDIDDIRAAADRIAPLVQTTPMEESRAISSMVGGRVLLKCEHLQRTGSFKIRGAANRIACLSDAERAAGVVCASAGNHAQGVALSALGRTSEAREEIALFEQEGLRRDPGGLERILARLERLAQRRRDQRYIVRT